MELIRTAVSERSIDTQYTALGGTLTMALRFMPAVRDRVAGSHRWELWYLLLR
jgi:hypothetical protein